MSEHQVEQIDIDINAAKTVIGHMNALNKLSNNKDFKSLIEVNYFEKEASRLVLLKADNNMQSDEQQKAVNKSIDAIGHFRQYLISIMQLGRMAEKAIDADEQTRDELLAKDAVN